MADSAGSTRRLGGSLTLADAIAQSVGVMGPVFSIAFLVPLLVGLNASGSGAGAAAPLSVAIGAIGVLGLGWIVAQYARRIHTAGSLYDHVTEGLGKRTGAAAGLLYYVGILVLGVGILVMIGGTIHDTLEAEFGITPLPEVVYLAGTTGIVVTGAAIFGAVYKVGAPIIYAPYAAIGVFVIGLVLALVHRERSGDPVTEPVPTARA